MVKSAGQVSKIINDPVYGFINIQPEIIFKLTEHPYFQRLRRIKQLGLTNLIYPGANHTRFQHSLGAFSLMQSAIEVLRSKGHDITEDEAVGVSIAILLHDLGHGPFSHTLEGSFIPDVSHETLTLLMMEDLNHEFSGQLNTAIAIYKNQYPKKYLHQLVSSQLDVDRLDYLRRDSFFTGVYEGTIGSDRIIKMLNVKDDELVVDAKGIYSIEKFLIARRLMYWQVYFHKTSLAAEQQLLTIFNRVKHLRNKGAHVTAPENLEFFFGQRINSNMLYENKRGEIIYRFSMLDDDEVMYALKTWMHHSDPILAVLSKRLLNRNLLKIKIQDKSFSEATIKQLKAETQKHYGLTPEESSYLVFSDFISNNAYSITSDKINILYKNGTLKDIAQASDMSNVSALAKTVKKYFLCFPQYFTNIVIS